MSSSTERPGSSVFGVDDGDDSLERIERNLQRNALALRQQMQTLDVSPLPVGSGSLSHFSECSDNVSSTCDSSMGSMLLKHDKAVDAETQELRRHVQQLSATLGRLEASQKEGLNAIWDAIRDARAQKVSMQGSERSAQELRWDFQRLQGRVDHLEHTTNCHNQLEQLSNGLAEAREHVADLSRRMTSVTQSVRHLQDQDTARGEESLADQRLDALSVKVDALCDGAMTRVTARQEELDACIEQERLSRSNDMEHLRKVVDSIAAKAVKCSPRACAPDDPALQKALEAKLFQYTETSCARVRNELVQEVRECVERVAKEVCREVLVKAAPEASAHWAAQGRTESLAGHVEERFAAGAFDAPAAGEAARGSPAARVRGSNVSRGGMPRSRSHSPSRCGNASPAAGRRASSPGGSRPGVATPPGTAGRAAAPEKHVQFAGSVRDTGRGSPKRAVNNELMASLQRLNVLLDSTLRQSIPEGTSARERGLGTSMSDSGFTELISGLNAAVSRTLQEARPEADAQPVNQMPGARTPAGPAPSPAGSERSPLPAGGAENQLASPGAAAARAAARPFPSLRAGVAKPEMRPIQLSVQMGPGSTNMPPPPPVVPGTGALMLSPIGLPLGTTRASLPAKLPRPASAVASMLVPTGSRGSLGSMRVPGQSPAASPLRSNDALTNSLPAAALAPSLLSIHASVTASPTAAGLRRDPLAVSVQSVASNPPYREVSGSPCAAGFRCDSMSVQSVTPPDMLSTSASGPFNVRVAQPCPRTVQSGGLAAST